MLKNTSNQANQKKYVNVKRKYIKKYFHLTSKGFIGITRKCVVNGPNNFVHPLHIWLPWIELCVYEQNPFYNFPVCFRSRWEWMVVLCCGWATAYWFHLLRGNILTIIRTMVLVVIKFKISLIILMQLTISMYFNFYIASTKLCISFLNYHVVLHIILYVML